MNLKNFIIAMFLMAIFKPVYASELVIVKGQVMTGINRYLGEPVWNLGPILGNAGFDLVYEYRAEETLSIPVGQQTPVNVILATGINEEYLNLFGVSPEDIPSNLVNIPLNDVPVISSPSLESREDFNNIFHVSETSNSRVYSSDEITLKKWKKAKGVAKISCKKRSSSVRFHLRNMLPNSLYTAWAVYGVDSDFDGIYDALLPRPFGGIPNVVTTNASGNGYLFRKIKTCPFSDESDLLWVEFDYHADGSVYGGVPDFTLEGYPSGIVSQSHVAFGFNILDAN